MNNEWSPSSWRSKPLAQRVVYPDQQALNQALIRLAKLPPLVTSWEVEKLRGRLADAARGERFLLQGGDCAEEFDECESSIIANKLKILLQMSLVLVYGCRRRVINVGRFAGQYAKPRSSDTETRDGVTLPSYRGCNINRRDFTKESRTPNPELLLRGHEHSAMTLNFIRAWSMAALRICTIPSTGISISSVSRRKRANIARLSTPSAIRFTSWNRSRGITSPS